MKMCYQNVAAKIHTERAQSIIANLHQIFYQIMTENFLLYVLKVMLYYVCLFIFNVIHVVMYKRFISIKVNNCLTLVKY